MNEIVLLDTTSNLEKIKCISVPFHGTIPEYYAISYRWGVHREWKAQTPNYVASITSISRRNLIKLCDILQPKTRYIWIDIVCIDPANVCNTKVAINNVADIFLEAKRVVAVPDLCYCSEYPLMEAVTKEDIETAYEAIWDYEVDCEKCFCTGGRLLNESPCFYPLKATTFIFEIIQQWAYRCSVIRERTIGVKHNKLDVIILRADGAKIPYWHWKTFLPIDWNITFDQHTLIKTIINSKSTKYTDRLFAILPHTQYKDAAEKLVDDDLYIDNMIGLKMTLMDVLDTEGQMILLNDMLFQDGGFPHMSPSVTEDKGFRSSTSDNIDTEYYSEIQTANHN
ncbi:hypothetical protein EC973_007626, partial [Apophysomyces ossiformis]